MVMVRSSHGHLSGGCKRSRISLELAMGDDVTAHAPEPRCAGTALRFLEFKTSLIILNFTRDR